MTPNLIQTTAALALALTCGAAAAQSGQSFVGPAIGIAVTAQNNKTPLTSQTIPSVDGQTPQGNDTAGTLLGSWGIALSDRWVATLGLAWDMKSTDAGQFTYTSGGQQTATLKVKEHLSLSVAPGYKVSPSTLVYGKLAYHQLKGDYSDTASTQTVYPDFIGTGVGVGLAIALAPRWELRAEYESVRYNEKNLGNSTAKPEQSLFSVGLLYKF